MPKVAKKIWLGGVQLAYKKKEEWGGEKIELEKGEEREETINVVQL